MKTEPKRRTRISQETIDGIIRAREESGDKMQAIAARYGVSVRCVFYWCEKLSLKRGSK